LELTEALIEGAIDGITGFMVARAAEELNRPLAEMMECFLASNTYKLLSDKETGLYWDNLDETYDMFMREMRLQYMMSGGSGIDRNAKPRVWREDYEAGGSRPRSAAARGGDCPAEQYSAPPLDQTKKPG
jgi:hypothetical protein